MIPLAVMKKAAAQYIFGAMTAWVSISNQTVHGEPEEEAKARYESTANDIVGAAFDEDEPAVFAGAMGKIKTALEMTSIGSLEGGFQKIVDDGTCNRPDFKADGRGNCDGHTAFTIWQIHSVGNGLMFSGTGVTSKRYNQAYADEHPEEVWTGPRLVENRAVAAKMALHLIRTSWSNYHSLCAYTGESCGDIGHPKADYRHQRAVAYYRTHPFTPPTEESLAESSPEPGM